MWEQKECDQSEIWGQKECDQSETQRHKEFYKSEMLVRKTGYWSGPESIRLHSLQKDCRTEPKDSS